MYIIPSYSTTNDSKTSSIPMIPMIRSSFFGTALPTWNKNETPTKSRKKHPPVTTTNGHISLAKL